MSRLALGALILAWATAAPGQRVPARDLIAQPLGLTGEAAALGGGAASGFWNPATGLLADGERMRIAAAALNSPIELAFAAQLVHVSAAFPALGTVSASIAHAAVNDLVRTDTDPQSIGGDIPYLTTLVSAGVSRRLSAHAAGGLALRWHWGRADAARSSALAADAGIVIDRLTRADARLALSTFMLTVKATNAPVFAAAGDIRVAGPDSARTIRAGVSFTRQRGALAEWYPYVDARHSKLSVRGGPVYGAGYGASEWRFRLGLALQQAGYAIGIAREDNAGGLSATYQLTVTNIRR